MAMICPLFSGSTGNSTYIAAEHGALLIDAGASGKAIFEAIEAIGGDGSKISAVAVTHEHIDHIKGLKPILKKTGAPLIASLQTLEALAAADKIPSGTRVIEINSGSETEISGFLFKRFATSHDCAGSSGYTVTVNSGQKIAVCTDLGVVTDTVRNALIGSDAVLIESNHDTEMLKKGPYPPELKLRIASDSGHLSNNACAAELPLLLKNGTKRFILGHISMHNNTPMLAESCAVAALIDCGAVNGRDYLLKTAMPKGNRITVV